MLINHHTGALAGSRPVACAGLAIVLSVVTWTSAPAAEVTDSSCLGGPPGFNCVTQSGPAGSPYVRPVPQPLGEAERAVAEARDRRWRARCHPTIRYDQYGVGRYHYSATGCEFGVGEN